MQPRHSAKLLRKLPLACLTALLTYILASLVFIRNAHFNRIHLADENQQAADSFNNCPQFLDAILQANTDFIQTWNSTSTPQPNITYSPFISRLFTHLHGQLKPTPRCTSHHYGDKSQLRVVGHGNSISYVWEDVACAFLDQKQLQGRATFGGMGLDILSYYPDIQPFLSTPKVASCLQDQAAFTHAFTHQLASLRAIACEKISQFPNQELINILLLNRYLHDIIVQATQESYATWYKTQNTSLASNTSTSHVISIMKARLLSPSRNVVVYIRCGDILTQLHPSYGFLKHKFYRVINANKRLVDNDTIVWLKVQLSAQGARDQDRKNFEMCSSVIQHERFMRSMEDIWSPAEVRLLSTGSKEEDIIRLGIADVTICSTSTFCFYGALVNGNKVILTTHGPYYSARLRYRRFSLELMRNGLWFPDDWELVDTMGPMCDDLEYIIFEERIGKVGRSVGDIVEMLVGEGESDDLDERVRECLFTNTNVPI